jgi:hypothetical protein
MADHVDAHRSTATGYGFVKEKNFVDHTNAFYFFNATK